MQNLKKQSGTVILLGIIITTIILIIGTGVSVLVISEIKQSKSVDESAMAYYLAEYGVEDGLYEVRKRGKDINSIDKNDILSVKKSWSRTASDKRDEAVIDSLPSGASLVINLYNSSAVDADGVMDYHANIEAISVECEKNSTNTMVMVNIEILKLNSDNMDLELSNDITPHTAIHYCKNPDDEGTYSEYNNLSITPSHAIQVKITSVGTDEVHNLIFKAYADNARSTQAQIMDKQIIKSSGTYLQTKAGLQAEMELEPPW